MISMKEIFGVVDRLHGLLGMDIRGWWKYYSGGERPTLTRQIMMVGHHSRMPLRMGMRELWKYYSGEKRSTPTGQIMTAEHRSRMPLRMDMREW